MGYRGGSNGIFVPVYQGAHEGTATSDGDAIYDQADFQLPTIDFPAGLAEAMLYVGLQWFCEEIEDTSLAIHLDQDQIASGGSGFPGQRAASHWITMGQHRYSDLQTRIVLTGYPQTSNYGFIQTDSAWAIDQAFQLRFSFGIGATLNPNVIRSFSWRIDAGYIAPR